MSKTNQRISLAACILLLIGLFVAVGFKKEREGQTGAGLPLTASVVRKPMTILVTASGEIDALKSTKIIPRIRSSAVISYLVPEGARVTAGEVVGRLNGDDLLIAIEELEQGIEDKNVELKDAIAALEIQKVVNETNLKSAQDGLTAAEMELKKFDDADVVMRTRSTELAQQTAESNLSRSEKRYADLKTLLSEGFITEDEVEEGRITVEQDRVSLETAKMYLKVLSEFTFPLERNEIVNKLSKARITLQKTTTENDSTLNTKMRAVQKIERDLAQTQRSLDERRLILSGYTIAAPTDGVVYYGTSGYRSSRANIEIGGTIYDGYTMFTIPDLSGMKARINVSESEIHKLQLDLPVTLKIDAVPGQIINGQIIKIAEVAKDNGYWRGGGVKEFEVEVSIADDSGLKPGYSCRAEIVTEEIPDALQLPVQAVFRGDDHFFVYLAEGKEGQKRVIEIGQTSTTHVQITSGLEEGEVVYLTPPSGIKNRADEAGH